MMTSTTEHTKKISGLSVFIGILIVLGIWVFSSYNGIISADENANNAFANIETRLQERYDLVPNLVSTVKGAAEFEKSTFTEITNARTQWLNASTSNEKIQASNAMEGSLARLLVTVENYPNLKATESFMTLQAQLEGIENRLAVERIRYNKAATQYNSKIRRIPMSLLANMFGFERHALFSAVSQAQTAPNVSF